MRSFKHKPDNRRQVYLALASQIEGQLRDAYAKRHEEDSETQSSIAEKLGVDRSAVHRRLTGRVNMTIETLADMIWALRHCIKVEIFDPTETRSNGRHVIPLHTGFEKIEGANVIASSYQNIQSAQSHLPLKGNFWISSAATMHNKSMDVSGNAKQVPTE